MEELKDEYNKLKEEYNKLKEETDKLKEEYLENNIIQSMNDMRKEYINIERQLDIYRRTTVPIIRYSKLEERYNNLVEVLTGVGVIVKHSKNTIEKIKGERKYIARLEMEYILINDIIVDNLNIN